MSAAPCSTRAGFVLMEVVLALLLLVGAAAVLLGGLNSAARAVAQLEREVVAADLACTVLSGVQMGLLTAVSTGPVVFGDDFPGWDWEVVCGTPEPGNGRQLDTSVGGPALREVEVIVRHREGFERSAGEKRSSLIGSEGVRGTRAAERTPTETAGSGRSMKESKARAGLTYRLKQQLVVGAIGFGRAFENKTASDGDPENVSAVDDGEEVSEDDAESPTDGGRDEEDGATGRNETDRSDSSVEAPQQPSAAEGSQMEEESDPNLPRELEDFFREKLRDPFANPLLEETNPTSGGYR